MHGRPMLALAALSFGMTGALAAPAAAATSTLQPAPFSGQDRADRCRGVIQDAVADYENIDTAITVDESTFTLDLTSADPFPLVVLDGKLCSWIDADGDNLLDAEEEPSLRADTGPVAWPAATSTATVIAPLDGRSGRLCARLWMHAFYPDGRETNKRALTACTIAGPPAVVPDASHVVMLSASALALAGGMLLAGRRATAGRWTDRRHRPAFGSTTAGSLSADEPIDRRGPVRGGRPRR